MLLLRLAAAATLLAAAAMSANVIVEDFTGKSFIVYSEAASAAISISCTGCSATTFADVTPVDVSNGNGIFRMVIPELVVPDDAGATLTFTGMVDDSVVFNGYVRTVGALPENLANGSIWQTFYTDNVAKNPEKRYISEIRTMVVDGVLTAVLIEYSGDPVAYQKFGDQAVAWDDADSFALNKLQVRRVIVHYADGGGGVTGIQFFTSDTQTAATTFGQPGTAVTFNVGAMDVFEGFIGRSDGTNFYLFPVAYELVAPYFLSYEPDSGNRFVVNFRMVNDLNAISLYWTEANTGATSQESATVTIAAPGVQDIAITVNTAYSGYFSLNINLYAHGINNNWMYGQSALTTYSTSASQSADISTPADAPIEVEVVATGFDQTGRAADLEFSKQFNLNNSTVLWPSSIRFSSAAFEIISDDVTQLLGVDGTTIPDAALHLGITMGIVNMTVYKSATGFAAVTFETVNSGSTERTLHTFPVNWTLTDEEAVNLYPEDCPNCWLSSVGTVDDGTELRWIVAVWRYVPAPYLMSLDPSAGSSAEVTVTWWHQYAYFTHISVFYQQSVTGGRYREAKCEVAGRLAGQSSSCILPHLSAATMYNVYLIGRVESGWLESTRESLEVSVTTTSGVLVNCEDGRMHMTVDYEAVPQSAALSQKPGIDLCVEGSAGCDAVGSTFDTSDVQNQRPATQYFIATPVAFTEFSGYPTAIFLKQSDAVDGPFEGLRIDYAFLDEPRVVVPNGVLDSYPMTGGTDNTVYVVDLTGRSIHKVVVKFDADSYLNRVKFYFTNADGSDGGSSPCYGMSMGGADDCEDGTEKVDEYQSFLVSSFSGVYVDSGAGALRITKLKARFSLQVLPTMMMADRDDPGCAMNKSVDVNFMEDSLWSASILLDQDLECGTSQSVQHQPNLLIQDRRFTVLYTQLLTRLEDDINANDIIKAGQAAISRAIFFQITPMCYYKADAELLIQFETLEEAGISAAGYSSLSFNLLMYQSATFSDPYDDMPVTVVVGGDIFYAVELVSDQNGLSILARDCWVSTSNMPTAVHNTDINVGPLVYRYELEAETCPEEETWERVEAARTATFDPMMFQSFYMVNAPQAEIFIHCRIYACNEEESGGLCAPSDTCSADQTEQQAARQRRDLDALAEQGIVKREIVTSRTRLFLQNDHVVQITGSAFMMNVVAGLFLLVVMTVFVTGLVVVRRKIKASREMAKKLVA